MGGLKEEPTKVETTTKSDDWGDLLVLNAPSFGTSLADLVWGDQLGEEFETKFWAPTATLHRSKLEDMHKALSVVSNSIPQVISKIDGDVRSNFRASHTEIAALKEDRLELQDILGDLMGAVAEHGNLVNTVSHLMNKSIHNDKQAADANVEIGKLFDSVHQANTKLEGQNPKVLTVISKVQRNCGTRIGLI